MKNSTDHVLRVDDVQLALLREMAVNFNNNPGRLPRPNEGHALLQLLIKLELVNPVVVVFPPKRGKQTVKCYMEDLAGTFVVNGRGIPIEYPGKMQKLPEQWRGKEASNED